MQIKNKIEVNMYLYKAKILSVHDGDSCVAELDLGCRIKIKLPIRLYGINAPELRGDTKLAGLEARDFLASKILNKEVYVKTFKDRTEKYGRLLGKIFLTETSDGNDDSTETVNQMLVLHGHAVEVAY
jgi:micrococcal nuclease